ncbi:uncharacterized protein LOC120305657 [Crotalus tigris]|uniref:uncharacterized protein LOC120305657 n=1 Tax=Crotalus tigris TaxID=88082 RepID=UPI00192F9679|nr:uncharacterized protein LOC120305657 [Crotalus tigris]
METITWITVLLWVNLGAGSWTDSSPTTRLSLSPPHSIFTRGERMTLICSVPDRYQPLIFVFHCKNESGSSILNKTHQENTWNINISHLNGTKKLICNCSSKSLNLTKFYSSPFSSSREILVVDTPPPPRFKFDPLTQTMKEGDCLILLCSVEGGIREKKFHFYKDGVEITSSQECLQKGSSEPADLLQSGSLRILSDHSTHRGEFACRYAEKRSNRWLMSSWSQGLNITVWTKDPDPVWRYSWIAISLIILLFPVAFYGWKKKKQNKNIPSSERLKAKENEAEKGDHGTPRRQATAAPVKESEIIYSVFQISSTLSSPGPEMEDYLPPEEEMGVLYSDLLFPQKARKHRAC